ncbi:MAG TPA: hypothetical protein ENJ68_01275 [Devosia sp.]|nr:hypothetical protein [Devosia sp.]
MFRFFITIMLVLLVLPQTARPGNLLETDYQARFCAHMQREVRLGPQRRADCMTSTLVIEVDWADKWKEGIGQSLAYAAETGLVPGIILVCRQSKARCLASSLFTRQTLSRFGISAVIWECVPADKGLQDCVLRRTGGRAPSEGLGPADRSALPEP